MDKTKRTLNFLSYPSEISKQYYLYSKSTVIMLIYYHLFETICFKPSLNHHNFSVWGSGRFTILYSSGFVAINYYHFSIKLLTLLTFNCIPLKKKKQKKTTSRMIKSGQLEIIFIQYFIYKSN